MVSRIHILLFLLCIFLAEEAMALQQTPVRSAISPPLTSRAERALRRELQRSQRALPKTTKTTRQIIAQAKKQSQEDAAAAKLIIDEMVPKLVAPRGAWGWRYYDIIHKLDFLIRKTHLNAEVIERLNQRNMIIPTYTTRVVTTGGYKGRKYKLTKSPSSDLKEVMAEVWVERELHKNDIRRRFFLGYDWKDGKTYQSYLGSNTPDISSLSEDNIMNLPVWTRYRLVEDRIGELTTPHQQKTLWNRTQVAVELGYDQAIRAAPRWLAVDLLRRPKEMIQLLKSKELFTSPPKKISFNEGATTATLDKRLEPTRSTPIVTRSRSAKSLQKAKAAAAKSRRRLEPPRSTPIVTRSRSARRQKDDIATAVRPRTTRQPSRFQTTPTIQTVATQPTPLPTPQTAPSSAGSTTPPATLQVTPPQPTPIPTPQAAAATAAVTVAPPVTPSATAQVMPQSRVPTMKFAWE